MDPLEEITLEIQVHESKSLKEKPQTALLGFGKHFTDHMFICDWSTEKGWHDARIVPYGPICLEPASMVLHYAQETFEGLKAYKTHDGRILLFRPDMNARRMSISNQRLCMPIIPEDMFIEAIEVLVKQEKDWIPSEPGTSLYLRPFMFASEAGIGVHAANQYKFMIICSPVGSYFPEGISPTKIYVEEEYVRAVKGGTGFAKCGGNYAGSIAAQAKAAQLGYSQVLWLDGIHHKYIEEVGTMNVMFLIRNEIYTAPIEGTVLAGITRDSVISLLKAWGYIVHEVPFSIDDLLEASHKGELEEAFGTGTAAVISPIGELNYRGELVRINDFKPGVLTQRIYDTLTGIQWGNIEDTYSWTREIR